MGTPTHIREEWTENHPEQRGTTVTTHIMCDRQGRDHDRLKTCRWNLDSGRPEFSSLLWEMWVTCPGRGRYHVMSTYSELEVQWAWVRNLGMTLRWQIKNIPASFLKKEIQENNYLEVPSQFWPVVCIKSRCFSNFYLQYLSLYVYMCYILQYLSNFCPLLNSYETLISPIPVLSCPLKIRNGFLKFGRKLASFKFCCSLHLAVNTFSLKKKKVKEKRGVIGLLEYFLLLNAIQPTQIGD